MKPYLELLQHIVTNGQYRTERTGTGTYSIFGAHAKIDLTKGYPLLTTKRVYFKGVVHELLWFLSGDTNIKYLLDNDVHIWDEWADANGDLGPVYGKQWRDFGGIDQVQYVIDEIKNNPNSRRMLVSAWNPPLLPDPHIDPKENVKFKKQALPPCHYSWQCYVNNGRLSLLFNARSQDVFLGTPFNWASYALLCHMIAHVCDLEVGDLVYNGGDCHIYSNHIEQVREQLSRTPKQLPKLHIKRKVDSIFDFKFEDFELEGYEPYPAIRAPIAI